MIKKIERIDIPCIYCDKQYLEIQQGRLSKRLKCSCGFRSRWGVLTTPVQKRILELEDDYDRLKFSYRQKKECESLTEKEQEMLNFCKEYYKVHDKKPSIKLTMERFKIGKSSVQKRIDLIEKKGYIRRTGGNLHIWNFL